MIILEVFKKRRKFEPILQKTWDRISADIIYPPVAEEQPEQKLVYFAMLSYATVYSSALAAGMSPDAGHYLARMQVGKYKIDKPIIKAVEAVFSGSDREQDRAYADFFLTNMAKVVEMVAAGEGGIESVLRALADGFKKVEFS